MNPQMLIEFDAQCALHSLANKLFAGGAGGKGNREQPTQIPHLVPFSTMLQFLKLMRAKPDEPMLQQDDQRPPIPLEKSFDLIQGLLTMMSMKPVQETEVNEAIVRDAALTTRKQKKKQQGNKLLHSKSDGNLLKKSSMDRFSPLLRSVWKLPSPPTNSSTKLRSPQKTNSSVVLPPLPPTKPPLPQQSIDGDPDIDRANADDIDNEEGNGPQSAKTKVEDEPIHVQKGQDIEFADEEKTVDDNNVATTEDIQLEEESNGGIIDQIRSSVSSLLNPPNNEPNPIVETNVDTFADKHIHMLLNGLRLLEESASENTSVLDQLLEQFKIIQTTLRMITPADKKKNGKPDPIDFEPNRVDKKEETEPITSARNSNTSAREPTRDDVLEVFQQLSKLIDLLHVSESEIQSDWSMDQLMNFFQEIESSNHTSKKPTEINDIFQPLLQFMTLVYGEKDDKKQKINHTNDVNNNSTRINGISSSKGKNKSKYEDEKDGEYNVEGDVTRSGDGTNNSVKGNVTRSDDGTNDSVEGDATRSVEGDDTRSDVGTVKGNTPMTIKGNQGQCNTITSFLYLDRLFAYLQAQNMGSSIDLEFIQTWHLWDIFIASLVIPLCIVYHHILVPVVPVTLVSWRLYQCLPVHIERVGTIGYAPGIEMDLV
jgi:hypothetical protein